MLIKLRIKYYLKQGKTMDEIYRYLIKKKVNKKLLDKIYNISSKN